MSTQGNIPEDVQYRLQKHTAAQYDPETQIEIQIGNDTFIVRHVFTGVHTILEVYEDFLKRAIKNH